MIMTKYSMLFAALALVVAPACKKKDADTAAKTDQPATGSATPTTAAKPTEAPKPEPVKPKTGQELVELYKTCGEDINSNKLDDFYKNCVDASYVGHESDGKDIKFDDLKAHFAAMHEA